MSAEAGFRMNPQDVDRIYVRNRFGEMVPFNHRVRPTVGGRVYLLPINLLTARSRRNAAPAPPASHWAWPWSWCF